MIIEQFSSAQCDGCNGWEIVIGGWNNTRSVFRKVKSFPAEGNVKAKVKSQIERNSFL